METPSGMIKTLEILEIPKDVITNAICTNFINNFECPYCDPIDSMLYIDFRNEETKGVSCRSCHFYRTSEDIVKAYKGVHF